MRMPVTLVKSVNGMSATWVARVVGIDLPVAAASGINALVPQEITA